MYFIVLIYMYIYVYKCSCVCIALYIIYIMHAHIHVHVCLHCIQFFFISKCRCTLFYWCSNQCVGALRNISSAGEDARGFMRSCPQLVDSLMWVVRAATGQEETDEKVLNIMRQYQIVSIVHPCMYIVFSKVPCPWKPFFLYSVHVFVIHVHAFFN